MRPDFGPHFLIATEDEAAHGALSVPLDGDAAFAAWDEETHAIGPEQLAELQCEVLARARDYGVLDNYEIVFKHDEMHGPWLIRLPDELVRSLASLDDDELVSVGERWFQGSDGFNFRQAPRDWVVRLGIRLATLAKRAVEQGKQMYWESPSC